MAAMASVKLWAALCLDPNVEEEDLRSSNLRSYCRRMFIWPDGRQALSSALDGSSRSRPCEARVGFAKSFTGMNRGVKEWWCDSVSPPSGKAGCPRG